jgi:hypothetical protein
MAGAGLSRSSPAGHRIRGYPVPQQAGVPARGGGGGFPDPCTGNAISSRLTTPSSGPGPSLTFVEQSRGGHALKKVVKPYGLVMPGVRAIVRTVSGMPLPPGMPSKDCEAGGGPPKMIPPDGRAGPDCMARGSAYQEETVIGEEGRIITCEDLMCMREGNTIRGIVILGLLLVIMVSGAAAQPKISSTPAAITLAQTNHYWFSSLPRAGEWTAEKNLVLDATDNITGLSFWPPDISQEDGR